MARPLTRLVALSVTSLLLAVGCGSGSSRRSPPPAQYPPGAYGQYPPGQQPPPGQYPPEQQPPPGQTQPGAPAPVPQGPLPPVVNDPINFVDINFLRGRAQSIIRELLAALPADKQSRVAGIPLIIDDTPGEVNAFAACINGKALMAITDGMLDIESHLARAKAMDEVFGTRKLGEYIALVAKYQRPNQPIVRPPVGFFPPAQDVDGRKVKRQHELFDEQVAFVLGHELGHHYLGHLPCTAGGGAVTAGDVNRVLAGAVPLFNQPNEIGSDIAGTQNVLTAGMRRPGYKWTEGGGLLTMQFFAGMDQMSPIDIVFGFERSHPPPQIRTPIIQQTANNFRASGGATSPLPFPWPF